MGCGDTPKSAGGPSRSRTRTSDQKIKAVAELLEMKKENHGGVTVAVALRGEFTRWRHGYHDETQEGRRQK